MTVLPDPDPFTSRDQQVYHLDMGFVDEPIGTDSGSLLFLHKLSPSMTRLDFGTTPPTISTISYRRFFFVTQGCAQHNAKCVLLVDGDLGRLLTEHSDSDEFFDIGIFAYDVPSGSREWTLQRMPGETKNIQMSSVTADENGHIFVYDGATRGILVVTIEGKFQEILLKEGHEGIGEIQKIKWCKTLNSLAVAHKKQGKIHISLVEVNF